MWYQLSTTAYAILLFWQQKKGRFLGYVFPINGHVLYYKCFCVWADRYTMGRYTMGVYITVLCHVSYCSTKSVSVQPAQSVGQHTIQVREFAR